jgi:hypothetical protein
MICTLTSSTGKEAACNLEEEAGAARLLATQTQEFPPGGASSCRKYVPGLEALGVKTGQARRLKVEVHESC